MRTPILLASDSDTHSGLRNTLQFDGYEVAEVATAGRTLEIVVSGLHHVLILDSTLEGAGTFELCRCIRQKSEIGIILLGDRAGEQSRIDALNAGADDSLPPHFALPELLARLRALLRRLTRPSEESERIVLEDRAIDLRSHKVKGPGNKISHLTPKEFYVLQCLVRHKDKAQTHKSLAQTVWQRDDCGQFEFIRVVIKQLRRKLETDPENPRYIVTDHSVGYRFHSTPPSRPCMSKR